MTMNESGNIVALAFGVFFVLLGIMTIVGFSVQRRFLTILKNEHGDKWREMGSPSLFANNSIRNSFGVLMFLQKRGYTVLGNPRLASLGNFLRIYSRVYLIVFILALLSFLGMGLSKQ
jgi:hypothetical protein